MTQQPIHNREPILTPVPIAELRPTQITVGMREVEEKRQHWRERAERERRQVSRAVHDPGLARPEATALRDRPPPPGARSRRGGRQEHPGHRRGGSSRAACWAGISLMTAADINSSWRNPG